MRMKQREKKMTAFVLTAALGLSSVLSAPTVIRGG